MSSRTGAYTNRMGVTFYLHAGKTKTGKPRFFVAKNVGAGALDALPAGFEFTESINGVVSVRRIPAGGPVVPPRDLDLARAEVSRHTHLSRYRADVVKGEIVIFEPSGGLSPVDLSTISGRLRLGLRASGRWAEDLQRRVRYAPVMKFVPAGDGRYAVHRMTYRGHGGWSWPLADGALEPLLAKYVRHIGTDRFFDLM